MSTTIEIRDQASWITMDDGKVNALSMNMLDALDEALDESLQADTKAIVLSGRPGRFSAGFDLKTMMAGPEQATALVKRGAEVVLKLFGLGKPTIGACTGHAMAGGALMLLACDHRIGVSGDFKVGLNETAIGVVLPRFALALARERMDRRHLCQATLQATIYTPADAVDVGFLDQVVTPQALEDEIQKEALRLGRLNTATYAHCKEEQRAGLIQQLLDDVEANLAEIVPGA